ncbi:hypothetical protein K502DRAFT_324611 [Neoconidiobolus thromboides FSU 785]|nr:hypothetical protein K502DRAFT_324611 [Neoconidiobolus thromboides FSU 785]
MSDERELSAKFLNLKSKVKKFEKLFDTFLSLEKNRIDFKLNRKIASSKVHQLILGLVFNATTIPLIRSPLGTDYEQFTHYLSKLYFYFQDSIDFFIEEYLLESDLNPNDLELLRDSICMIGYKLAYYLKSVNLLTLNQNYFYKKLKLKLVLETGDVTMISFVAWVMILYMEISYGEYELASYSKVRLVKLSHIIGLQSKILKNTEVNPFRSKMLNYNLLWSLYTNYIIQINLHYNIPRIDIPVCDLTITDNQINMMYFYPKDIGGSIAPFSFKVAQLSLNQTIQKIYLLSKECKSQRGNYNKLRDDSVKILLFINKCMNSYITWETKFLNKDENVFNDSNFIGKLYYYTAFKHQYLLTLILFKKINRVKHNNKISIHQFLSNYSLPSIQAIKEKLVSTYNIIDSYFSNKYSQFHSDLFFITNYKSVLPLYSLSLIYGKSDKEDGNYKQLIRKIKLLSKHWPILNSYLELKFWPFIESA